jgi:hypothetical protein
MSPLVLATLLAAAPRINTVAVRPIDGRPAVVVTGAEALPPVVVSRASGQLLVRVPRARLAATFAGPRFFAWGEASYHRGPAAAIPAQSLRILQRWDGVVFLFMMRSDVPFGVRQEGASLGFVFGDDEPPVPAARGVSLLAAAHPGPEGRTPPAVAAEVTPPPPAAAPEAAPPKTDGAEASRAPVFASFRRAGPAPASAPPAITVASEARGPRAVVTIRGGVGLPLARVRRESGEVIVTFDAGEDTIGPAPPAIPPIDAIDVEKVATLAVVHVRVAPEVPFDVKREQDALLVSFGEETAVAAEPPLPSLAEPPSGVDASSLVTADLYRSLFPSAAEVTGQKPAAPSAASDRAREGLQVGPVHLRPTIQTGYVDADTFAQDSPQPVRDQYLGIEPRVAAEMPILGGQLLADYTVRFRLFSSIPEVGTTSQFVNAGLEVPVGSRTVFRVRDHFATGVLETTEVDPGQEYFYDLTRFHRNLIEVGARVDTGGRYFLDLSGGWNDVTFDQVTTFFPYTERTARAAFGTTFQENLRASLYYQYSRVPPPPDRPIVESTSNAIGLHLDGDFGALTHGQLDVGYENQQSPQAAPGGQSYEGVAATAAISRDFSPSSHLRLAVIRATDLSAFEQNAFYVSTGVQLTYSMAVPYGLAANAGVGYQWNDYRTVSPEIGVPRRDTIFGWSVGLARPLGSFAFVRADYRRDRRQSNLPGFDVTTNGFLLQMGLGLFGTSVR